MELDKVLLIYCAQHRCLLISHYISTFVNLLTLYCAVREMGMSVY